MYIQTSLGISAFVNPDTRITACERIIQSFESSATPIAVVSFCREISLSVGNQDEPNLPTLSANLKGNSSVASPQRHLAVLLRPTVQQQCILITSTVPSPLSLCNSLPNASNNWEVAGEQNRLKRRHSPDDSCSKWVFLEKAKVGIRGQKEAVVILVSYWNSIKTNSNHSNCGFSSF